MEKETFDKLKEYDKVFSLALNANFIHLSNGEFEEIAKLYKEALGKELTSRQKGCNTCRLKAIKELGTAYVKAKEENKPKRGRPKKIDLDANE